MRRGDLASLSFVAVVVCLACFFSERARAPARTLASFPPPRSHEPAVHAVHIQDASALDAFHRALHRAERGEGTAGIVFYGGSHTAGDLFTGRVRELLQQQFGDAGHGFLPLVTTIVEQWAWGIRLEESEGWEPLQVGMKRFEIDRYGLAGIAFVANEPGAFAGAASDHWGNGRYASRITLFYDRGPNAGSLDVWLDGQRIDTLSTTATAPQAATRVYRTSDATHRFEVRARGDGPVTLYGAAWERDRPGVLVDNLGVVGGKARHQLLWDVDQWRAFFVSRRPDLVAFVYGTNEVDDDISMTQHEDQLRRVVARVMEAAPEASCLLIGPSDRPVRRDGRLTSEPLVAAIGRMQRRVAHALGCAFFDTLAVQGGLGGGIRWAEHDPPYMREDLLHLTREGYARWAEVLTAALLEGYD